MRIGWSGWSVDVDEGWKITDHPECLTLERSADAALQLSSARKTSGEVTDADLQDFVIEQVHEWGVAAPAQCGEFSGIVVHYSEEGSLWSRWFLRNGTTLLFATYNGTPETAARESDLVSRVLASARPEAASEA
jgi:hypothetical protein